ncbi:MAG: helix-turn-helix domain-containing protein [Desulfomicrobium sp.]|nr:helix-turn-helix domain-containing protein [Desulfomicrobium sp.]
MRIIKDAIKNLGNQQAVSDITGVPQSTISKILKGKGISLETACRILDGLGVKLVPPGQDAAKEVCFVDAKIVPVGQGLPEPVPEDYYAVPLVDDVGAGGGRVLLGQIRSWFLVWKHQDAVRHKSNLVAVRIDRTANSMIPTLYPGDMVLVDLDDKTVDQPRRLWLVQDPDGEGKIKRVSTKHMTKERDYQIIYYSDNAEEYEPEVYSLNTHFEGKWDKAIIGRVLWGWTDLMRK